MQAAPVAVMVVQAGYHEVVTVAVAAVREVAAVVWVGNAAARAAWAGRVERGVAEHEARPALLVPMRLLSCTTTGWQA